MAEQDGNLANYLIPGMSTETLQLEVPTRGSPVGLKELIPIKCMPNAGVTSEPSLTSFPQNIVLKPGAYKYSVQDTDTHAAWYERCLMVKMPQRKHSSCDKGLLYVQPIAFYSKYPEYYVPISTTGFSGTARPSVVIGEREPLSMNWKRNVVHMFMAEYLTIAKYITEWLKGHLNKQISRGDVSIIHLSNEPPYIANDNGLKVWECDSRNANYGVFYQTETDKRPSWTFFSSINFDQTGNVIPLGYYIDNIQNSDDRTRAARDALVHIKGLLADMYMLRYFPINLSINSFGVRTIYNPELANYKTTIILLPIPHKLDVAVLELKIHDNFRTIPDNIVKQSGSSSIPNTAPYPTDFIVQETEPTITGMPPTPPALPSGLSPETRTTFYRYLTEFFPSWMNGTNPSLAFRTTKYSNVIEITSKDEWNKATNIERTGYTNYLRLRDEITANDAIILNEGTIARIVDTMVGKYHIQFP